MLTIKCPPTIWIFNTLRPRPTGRHFADDVFTCIFLNENVWIPIKISMNFVPKGPINIIPALVQIMAWRRPGDKPLSEPMVVSLTTHICVTRPQWEIITAPLTQPDYYQTPTSDIFKYSFGDQGPLYYYQHAFNLSMDKYAQINVWDKLLINPKLQWCSCLSQGMDKQLRKPRIWCCHYLPPGSLLTLGASKSISHSHVSFNLG